jgi:hypothetical protein
VQGKITDTNCLQQATADQAFTNAKAVGDVNGQVAALIYRALERNTGKVGLASVACTTITAKNPEIAAISQHQDPASPGAAATNKAIVLELAKQIGKVGGNPQEALNSGTFKPGNLNDNTGKGNTCDTQDDPQGCIFSQNLLVPDATQDEIDAAVADGAITSTSTVPTTTLACAASATVTVTAGDAGAATSPASPAAQATSTTAASTPAPGALNLGSCSDPTIKFANGLDGRNQPAFIANNQKDFNHGSALNIGVISDFICQQLKDKCKADAAALTACANGQTAASTLTGQAAADAFNSALTGAAPGTPTSPAITTAAAPSSSSAVAASGSNVQKFTGTLGGPAPPVISSAAARPFAVDGTTDINKAAAIQRSCDVQKNACANAANSGQLAGGVGQCDAQHAACLAANT